MIMVAYIAALQLPFGNLSGSRLRQEIPEFELPRYFKNGQSFFTEGQDLAMRGRLARF